MLKIIIFNDSPLTGVNTPGSDENSMKLLRFDDYLYLNVAELLKRCCGRYDADKEYFDRWQIEEKGIKKQPH